jgi:hypothetical protein
MEKQRRHVRWSVMPARDRHEMQAVFSPLALVTGLPRWEPTGAPSQSVLDWRRQHEMALRFFAMMLCRGAIGPGREA